MYAKICLSDKVLKGKFGFNRNSIIRKDIFLACKRRNRFFPTTATNNSFVSFYILKHFSAQSVSVSIICWTLFQIFISTSWNAIVKKEGIPTLRGFVGSTLMTFEGLSSPRSHSTSRADLNKKMWDQNERVCSQLFKFRYIGRRCQSSK